jgi:hypothetical protein
MARVREAARSEDVADVRMRLGPYLDTSPRGADAPEHNGHEASPALDELTERAVTFVTVMPPRQRRATIEELVCPHDLERGRRAVETLIECSYLAEDERGCLRLLR